MKRILLIISLLLVPSIVVAAGSSSVESREIYTDREVITITYTADAVNGSIPNVTFAAVGYVSMVEVSTGAVQPTALYDVAINTTLGTDSIDIMGGELSNLSQAGGEQKTPLVGSCAGCPRPVNGDLTVVFSNNSVASATGKLRITILK